MPTIAPRISSPQAITALYTTEGAVELRAKMFAELAAYVAPKRKAVDLSSEDEAAEPLTIEVRVIKPPVWVDE